MENILFPYFMERRTNISKEEIAKFSCENLAKILEDINKCKEALNKNIDNYIEILEKQFFITQNKKLLNLKRKVFNLKSINVNDLLEIDEKSSMAIEDYIKELKKLNTLEGEFKLLFEKEKEKNRELLYNFYKNDETVSRAFPLVNKNFDFKYKKYIETPVEDHNAKIKKLDHQLIRFLSRATMKTSPFSSLTSVYIGSLHNENKSENLQKFSSTCEINNYILKRILDGITEKQFFLKQCNLRVTLYKDYGDYYVFLGQKDYEKGKVYKTVDFNTQISKNKLLNLIITNFSNKVFNYEELFNYLCTFLEKAVAEKYIFNDLMKNRIITVHNTLNEFTSDIFESFFKGINVFKDDEDNTLLKIKENVIKLENIVMNFSEEGAFERFDSVKAMDFIIEDIENILKINFVHDILLYEDTYYKNSEKKVEIDDRFKDNFKNIQQYIKIFDQTYPVIKVFSNEFYKKYGTEKVHGTDLELYKLYSITAAKLSDVWKDTLFELNYEDSEDLNVILKLKKNFKEHLSKIKTLKESSVDIKTFMDKEILSIPKDFTNITDLDSSTIFYQKNKDKYVLNKVYNGRLIFFTRFLKLYPHISADTRFKEYINKIYGENTIEIREGFGFNANVHDELIKDRLILPLTDVDSSSTEGIKLEDCYFKYDEKRGLVKIYHAEKGELDVVYLGTLAYFLVPTMMKALLGLNISTRFDSAYLNFWEANTESDNLIIDRIPEICYDNIVLIRKQYLLKNIFDLKAPDTDLYAAVLNEFKNNKLPFKFFIRSYINGDGFDFYNLGRTQLKPQFIDLTSPLMFKEFIEKMENEKSIILEEINPLNEEDEYIHEYQIEYSTIREKEN